MKVAIVGAGAVGGFVGAMLARAGEDVTLVARGEHLRAMQARGLRVSGEAGDFTVRPVATGDLGAVGAVDVVFLSVKAHGLREVVPRLGPLLGPQTTVVSAQNGMPWWYFLRHGGEWDGARLESVDPGGELAHALDPRRIVGCVVYCSTAVAAPGVVRHAHGTRFVVGELDGEAGDRCHRIAEALERAGLSCAVRPDIRREVWAKLVGNVGFNPISALTRAAAGDLASFPRTRALAVAVMSEADAVARGLGVDPGVEIAELLAGAEQLGTFKTSMLQDLEAGRPLEIDAIAGAVVELAGRLGLPVPHLSAVYACAGLLDRSARRPIGAPARN